MNQYITGAAIKELREISTVIVMDCSARML